MSKNAGTSLKVAARQAKCRMKGDFWERTKQEQAAKLKIVEEKGLNRQEAERYLAREIEKRVRGEEQSDAFYEQVKQLLLTEGEVSDAIGRLTDKAVYESLSYTEKQRYTLELSERYLRALERFKRECIFFEK